ncbi:Oxygen-evolving enhancer protein 3-2, chloroplastic, partial [Cucurbita argyrosperma subsp. argyrosperma]
MASMAGFCGSSQAVLEGSLQISGSTRLSVAGSSSSSRSSVPRSGLMIRAQQVPAEPETSRRAVLGLVAAGVTSASFVQAARDLDLPLKDRFFLQPQSPEMAVARAKESAKDIINVKESIDKKAWPFVRDDLRLKAEYLRYDLKTIISAKPKEEKQALKDLTGKLFQDINNLDYAAKIKSSSEAEKYYAQTVSTLNDVLAKIG